MKPQKKQSSWILALAAGVALAATFIACDADDDVPVIVSDVDSGTKPVVTPDSGGGADAASTDAAVDTGTDAAATTDAGTDSASDAKND